MAEDYNLELQYRKPFNEIWDDEKDDPVMGPISERMGVRGRDRGPLMVSREELEAASEYDLAVKIPLGVGSRRFSSGFYHAFCFYKV